VAFTPLLSHATARPRQVGTSFVSQAKPAGRRLESQPTGTSQRDDLTHCHPGQARTVYSKSQSGGYARDCRVIVDHAPRSASEPEARTTLMERKRWTRLVVGTSHAFRTPTRQQARTGTWKGL
jgi:hypothetical protein